MAHILDDGREIYACIAEMTSGEKKEVYVSRGSDAVNGWFIASRTSDMNNAIWLNARHVLSLELHDIEE